MTCEVRFVRAPHGRAYDKVEYQPITTPAPEGKVNPRYEAWVADLAEKRPDIIYFVEYRHISDWSQDDGR